MILLLTSLPPLALFSLPFHSPLIILPFFPQGDRAGLEEAMGCAMREGLDVTEAQTYLASMHEEKRGKDDLVMRLQSGG